MGCLLFGRFRCRTVWHLRQGGGPFASRWTDQKDTWLTGFVEADEFFLLEVEDRLVFPDNLFICGDRAVELLEVLPLFFQEFKVDVFVFFLGFGALAMKLLFVGAEPAAQLVQEGVGVDPAREILVE